MSNSKPKNQPSYFKSRLPVLMYELNIDDDKELARVIEESGVGTLNRETIGRIKKNRNTQINMRSAYILCKFFKCTLDDLWELVETEVD